MTYTREEEVHAVVFMLVLSIFIVLALLLAWGWAERQQCYELGRAQGVVAQWSLATGCVGPTGPVVLQSKRGR